MVLTETELVAIDLTTEGWPMHRVPYLLSLSASSPVTCVHHAAAVSDAAWNNIAAAGSAQACHWSMKVRALSCFNTHFINASAVPLHVLLGWIKCMRCRLLLLMIVFVHGSVSRGSTRRRVQCVWGHLV